MKEKIKNVKLGEVLIQQGVITEIQLEEALSLAKTEEYRKRKALIGEILVELGYCTEEDITNHMSFKARVRVIDLNETTVNMSAANLISPEIARRYKAIPIDFNDNKDKLVVALQNPSDLIAIDDLSLLTGYEIEPVIVKDKQLAIAIDHFANMSTTDEDAYNEEEEIQFDEEEESSDDNMLRPAVQLANQILNQAMNAQASDIHIEPMEKKLKIRFRIDGVLHEIMNQTIKLAPSVASRFKILGNMDIAERRIPQDGRMSYRNETKKADIRIATLPTVYGEKVTLRLIDRTAQMMSIEMFNLPKQQLEGFTKAIKAPYGFILITGPTGSGKSTTLYAALEELNSPDKNIITLEDPVERRVEGINQIQINVRAGLTFSSGLRSILRSDPDILMIGEIRDHETAKIAVESALTGHLVLSTLHTNNSAGAVTRLGDMDVEEYLTASSLIGVMAQRLVRKLCKHCKEEMEMDRAEMIRIFPEVKDSVTKDKIKLFKHKGCINCSNTGYKGRIGVYEYLEVTDAIRELILKGGSTMEIESVAIKEGMTTLRRAGIEHVLNGLTSIEEFFRVIV
ncbi:MAG: Flp pilus assembly complex ATPase component TadA [Clostridia bacterium]|nr:Flp pilus assembly complex ATPase component TadA [Clostridia bacterium]